MSGKTVHRLELRRPAEGSTFGVSLGFHPLQIVEFVFKPELEP